MFTYIGTSNTRLLPQNPVLITSIEARDRCNVTLAHSNFEDLHLNRSLSLAPHHHYSLVRHRGLQASGAVVIHILFPNLSLSRFEFRYQGTAA
jgi:hypothetical protein